MQSRIKAFESMCFACPIQICKYKCLELRKTQREFICALMRLCLLSHLLASPLLDFLRVPVVAVVAVAVVLFRRSSRMLSTFLRVHVPARFAPLFTCCSMRLKNAVKSMSDIVQQQHAFICSCTVAMYIFMVQCHTESSP